MEEVSIKQKGKKRNFEDLMPTTKIDDKKVHIDPTILLAVLLIQQFLKNTLWITFPTSLLLNPHLCSSAD